jgi:phosphomevalonate decarboxylase
VTTVAFQEEKEVTLNGDEPDWDTASRIDAVVSNVKQLSGIDEAYKIVIESNLPQRMGIASSGCAALAVAAAEAAGLDLSHKELSQIARKGGGSACTSVTGWFSRWKVTLEKQFCYSFVIEDDLEMGMVAGFVEPFTYTGVRTEDFTSPYFESRLKTVHNTLYEMERAIKDHDIPKIGQLAEKDSIILHTVAMADEKMIMWNPDTLRVIAEVKALREEGVAAYFCVDAGSVYVNSYPEDIPVIKERLQGLGVTPVALSVGGCSRLIQEHLF